MKDLLWDMKKEFLKKNLMLDNLNHTNIERAILV